MPDKKIDPTDMSYCIHCGGYAADNYECDDCKAYYVQEKAKMEAPSLVPIFTKNGEGERKLKFFRRENY